MNIIGILTGALLMVLGIVEKSTMFFAIGMSLLLIMLLAEIFKGRLRKHIEHVSRFMRVIQLSRYKKKHKMLLQQAEEWITRFAIRYQALLQSDFAISPNGHIRIQSILSERPDGENIFAEFREFLKRKGIRIRDDLLRLEINDCILKQRLDRLKEILASIVEQRPTIRELFQIFIEEERRTTVTNHVQHFWSCELLQYYLESNYSPNEIRAIFPRRHHSLQHQITQYMNKLKDEYAVKWRMSQLEDWLIGVEDKIRVSMEFFDQSIHHFNEFRMGVVYLLEKIGYRVSLPDETEKSIDLIIERSGIKHGVMIKPLSINEVLPVDTIHEAHTARTLAKLQSIMIITNRGFASHARSLATQLGLICIDRDKLTEWLQQFTNPYLQTS